MRPGVQLLGGAIASFAVSTWSPISSRQATAGSGTPSVNLGICPGTGGSNSLVAQFAYSRRTEAREEAAQRLSPSGASLLSASRSRFGVSSYRVKALSSSGQGVNAFALIDEPGSAAGPELSSPPHADAANSTAKMTPRVN